MTPLPERERLAVEWRAHAETMRLALRAIQQIAEKGEPDALKGIAHIARTAHDMERPEKPSPGEQERQT